LIERLGLRRWVHGPADPAGPFRVASSGPHFYGRL